MRVPIWLLVILVLIPLSIMAHVIHQFGEERDYTARQSEETAGIPQNTVPSDSPQENDSAREWVEVTISERKPTESAVVLTEEEAGDNSEKLQYRPVLKVL